MRIVVDRDKCTGLGMCEAEAPDFFEIDDEGTLEVLDERPSEERRAEESGPRSRRARPRP